MSASPEFFKPAAAPAFSPLQLPLTGAGDDDYYGSSGGCRTPTGSGISYLREPTTCPPAPRKPPPPMCRKRLFQQPQAQGGDQQQQPESSSSQSHPVTTLISLRLDELERLFRPHPPPSSSTKDKRRRSSSGTKHCHDDIDNSAAAQRTLN